MDFVEGLPNAKDKSVIFVIVDRLSKFAHFIPVSHPYTIVSIAQVFFEHIFKLYEMPKSIICDWDVTFTGTFWKELLTCKELALILLHPTIPRPMGKQRWLIELLKCICAVSQATGQRNGYDGFYGLSIAIIPTSTPLLGGPLMRLFTVHHPPHFYLMFLALHKWRQWTKNWKIESKLSRNWMKE